MVAARDEKAGDDCAALSGVCADGERGDHGGRREVRVPEDDHGGLAASRGAGPPACVVSAGSRARWTGRMGTAFVVANKMERDDGTNQTIHDLL
ncbi:hypothetical protein AB0I98_44140 [Streptomyces sp. NPDC050211]|uniref:hypothetical protein n=1 Tax=Streptomyces sp. NPDC050211 TaxID=3154932 RepID=UPI00343A2898